MRFGMIKLHWPCFAAAWLSVFWGGCLSVDISQLLNPRLEEVTVRRAKGWTSRRVALVDVSGFISSRPREMFSWMDRCSPDGIVAALDKASRDRRVKAVVIRIDSPGGAVAPTDMIHHEILAFRERTGIPVVSLIMGTGCSGGYYIATAASDIIAHPSALTGSIGVIAVFPQLGGLAEKIGVDQVTIKSGELKDIGSPLRPMREAEEALLQGLILEYHGQFVEAVFSGREGRVDRKRLEELADGRVYTASQAQSHNLIDAVGYMDDALALAMARAGIPDAHVVTYTRGKHPDATPYTAAGAASPRLKVSALDLGRINPVSRSGFYYLWLPDTE